MENNHENNTSSSVKSELVLESKQKFCTNCGRAIHTKICPYCGFKRKTSYQFCEWCGAKIDPNAKICTYCHETIKTGIGSKIVNILGICFSCYLLIASIGVILLNKRYLSAVLFLLTALLLLPPIKNFIKNITHKKLKIRPFLTWGRRGLVIILFLAALLTWVYGLSYTLYNEDAIKAAIVVFHENVELKNEASFVVNDSKVICLDDNASENKKVTVILDYSSQNGFGGMNRQSYTITMIFDPTSGSYYRLDGSFILQHDSF